MNITDYIKPELLIVAVVCYFIGMGLKQAGFFPDKFIPLALGALSVVICLIYVAATSDFSTSKDVLMAVFTALTQGVLLAGASTYVNQLIKQNKEEN